MDVWYACFAGAKTGVLLYSGLMLVIIEPFALRAVLRVFKFVPCESVTWAGTSLLYTPCPNRTTSCRQKNTRSQGPGIYFIKAWRCPTLLRASCPSPYGPPTLRFDVLNRSRRFSHYVRAGHLSNSEIKKPLSKATGACLF